ncbi:MAG: ABC transporter substrate-binding protein [Pseudomonadota bacterium]|nr:ABC transporter substrate-binding protein [Pseudomonadota bacterium]
MRHALRTILVTAVAAVLLGSAALPAAAQKKGGSLAFSYQPEPSALSTIATTAVPTALVSTKIFESLLEYKGPELTPMPGLAESWTMAPDGLTYTFKLRGDVKWHDGKPFTSKDVKFSVEKLIAPMHSRGKVYFGDLAGIDTPDARTVVFKLKKPVPYFLKAFQPTESPMHPEHLLGSLDFSDAKNIRQSDFMSKPVGTGPFRFKEWKKGSHVILERNPDYWKKDRPFLDQVIFKVIPDGAARAIALETGEIDLAPMNAVPQADIARLGQVKNIQLSNDGAEGLGPLLWLEMNIRDKPLSDVRVRKAISMAINRKTVVDVMWYGQGKPARGPLVSGNPLFDASTPQFEYNPQKANQLLDQAGYPRGAGGVRFKMTQHFTPYGESFQRLAEYTKNELGKIGIQVETQSADMGGWLKAIYTDWSYNMTNNFTHNYSDPAIGTQRAFVSSNIRKGASFTNSMGYKNERIDELFAQSGVEIDPAKRKAQYAEIQKILADDLPVIFLIEIAYSHLWNKRVHGLITNGISMYSSWDSVWVD